MNAKSFFVPALGVSALLSVLLAPMPSKGEAGGPDDAAVATLLNDVAVQQAAIIDNQTKIDAKLAMIAENIRLARIFASRGK
jgi:hypothetical protein